MIHVYDQVFALVSIISTQILLVLRYFFKYLLEKDVITLAFISETEKATKGIGKILPILERLIKRAKGDSTETNSTITTGKIGG